MFNNAGGCGPQEHNKLGVVYSLDRPFTVMTHDWGMVYDFKGEFQDAKMEDN